MATTTSVVAGHTTVPEKSVLVSGRGVTVTFGGLVAVDHVDFDIYCGEILGMIGPNGAGKTTLFNAISGQCSPSKGELWLGTDGRRLDLIAMRSHEATRAGIARTFQNIRVFKALTTLENVLVGAHWRFNDNPLAVMTGLRRQRRHEKERRAEALELLSLLGLAEVSGERVGGLPYGFQRRVEIARALAASPRLLMVDEPTAGMNDQETADLVSFLRQIRQRFDLTLFVIEHDMRFIMTLSERLIVLNMGRRIAEGSPQEVQRDPAVIEAYLGGEDDA